MKINKYQQGGAVPPAVEQAPAQQDPVMMLIEMAAQGLQSQDCQIMAQVCQGLIEMAQGAQGEQPAPQGAPVFKAGGKIVRRK